MDRTGRRIVLPIIVVAVLSLVVSISVLGALAISLLSQRVGPALEANATVTGDRVRARIESAVALGIPFDALVGVEPYLAKALERSPGVASLALLDADGRTLYAAGTAGGNDLDGPGAGDRTEAILDLMRRIARLSPLAPGDAAAPHLQEVTLPLLRDGRTYGHVRVGVDHLHIARQLLETAIDIAVMTGIAVLLAVEALILITGTAVRGPLTQLARILTRLSGRNFTHEAAPVGSSLARRAIGAANALCREVNAAAAGVGARIVALRSGGGASEDVLAGAEARIDQIGRFARDGRPARLAATELVGVRAAAFLFVLAEELTRPFLPLFFGTVTGAPAQAGSALMIAAPISAFMLGLALAGPFAANWSDRAGRRTTFVAGALVSTAGLVWTAQAGGLGDLMLSRALSGLGYALTFVACQGQVIDRTDDRSRTWGMSVFVGGIMAADVCGPAIGGILAEQIGYVGALRAAAAVALIAAVLGTVLLDDGARRRPLGAGLSWRTTAGCLANPRFVAVLVLAAIPAKLLLTGFLFFLVPLLMLDLGASDAEIGRVAMLYGVAALALMPAFAWVCDRLQGHGAMVGLGGLLAGWALVPLAFGPTPALIGLAVLGLGAGHAMSIPAQSALVTFLGRAEIDEHGPGQVLGVYRLAERLGAVLGPLIGAYLLARHGAGTAAAIFGFVGAGLATVFCALFLSIGTRIPPQAGALPLGDEL